MKLHVLKFNSFTILPHNFTNMVHARCATVAQDSSGKFQFHTFFLFIFSFSWREQLCIVLWDSLSGFSNSPLPYESTQCPWRPSAGLLLLSRTVTSRASREYKRAPLCLLCSPLSPEEPTEQCYFNSMNSYSTSQPLTTSYNLASHHFVIVFWMPCGVWKF